MYDFRPPFPDGRVIVCGRTPRCGCTTVAGLCKTETNEVSDIGVKQPSLSEGDQLVYVHAENSGIQMPDWLLALSYSHQVFIVDFNSLYFTQVEWELRQTNQTLLAELEKLLPENNPVRVLRNQIRSNNRN